MFTDGSKAWLVRGPILEIINATNGEQLSSHEFAKATEDPSIHITSLSEFLYQGGPSLLLGLKSSSGQGLVCVYDLTVGKVKLAIKIPHGVSIKRVLNSGSSVLQ